MNKILSLTRRCVEDYEMIKPGDRIAVGVSGGKDSLVLLVALAHCLTGYCAMLNPASGHTAIIITAKPLFTDMVPAQWCCAGTATTSCVTRHPNHSSNLLIKTCQHG